MKLLFLMLFLVSCNVPEGQKPAVKTGTYDLFKYRDESDGVTCYRIQNSEGISCLKD
jgi:hypothetical protein